MELNHKVFGEGQPLIILHGMFGTLDNWQTIAKKLSENYMVYIIDQRNHGRSPHTDEKFNYKILAEDLRHFMESNWIYKAHLLGHSMGGKVVMEFALSNPEMVESLCVADIAPKSYKGGHELVFNAIRAVPLDKIQTRQEVEDILKSYIKDDQGTVSFLMKNLNRTTDGKGFEWKMNFKTIEASYSAILANIESHGNYDGGTIFIRGGNSKYIQEEDYPSIFKLFPHAEIETIPDAGHWVHAEQPEAFYNMYFDFVSKYS